MKTLAPINEFQLECVISDENKISRVGNDSKEVCVPTNGSSPSAVDESSSSFDGESWKRNDYPDTFLKFIDEMLMEEDLGNQPCMLHDALALQATEKALYDALNNDLDKSGSFLDTSGFLESNWIGDFESLVDSSEAHLSSCGPSKGIVDAVNRPHITPMSPSWVSILSANTQFDPRSSSGNGVDIRPLSFNYDQFLDNDWEQGNKTLGNYFEMVSDCSPSRSGVKKVRSREDDNSTEYHRNNKQLANYVDEPESLEMYDNVLIYSNSDSLLQTCGEAARRKSEAEDKINIIVKEFVDLKSLLMQSAQAASNFDNKALYDLLLQIRQYSSPRGDGMERLAHYFANALEARLAGTGTALYVALDSKRISAADILKAHRMFVIACPFRQMSNILANATIGNLANSNSATTLHIIDFGILYGCQWPCLIHGLSLRPGGPPKLRITGIDFPQPGFRPAERVVDTCRRLAKYGDTFGVPFEYTAIAKNWDTIRLEDLKIEKNEMLVVNSMYRLHNMQDETKTGNSPRDAVLNLIKRINPDMFIHGIANGTYNTPFFITRFKEAFFHFSTMFDMFESTIPQDDEDRLLFEQQFFGKEAMNIIACEGTERIERPETYKQWQVRTSRAGFRQLSFDQEILKRVSKVKTGYHKNFTVDKDGNWILLGWKGRVIQGLSCWKSTHNRSSR